MQFRYYYGKEADMFTFYRVPKLLVTDPYFDGISNDAKLLYGLMLDRMSLSRKNNWLDDEGRVYIHFSVEETMAMLRIGRNKAIGVIGELDSKNGIGLIQKKNQGQGKPAKIYVMNFLQEFENETSEDVQKFKKQTSKSLESKPLEVGISNPNNNKYNKTIKIYTKSNLIDGRDGNELAIGIRERLGIDCLIEREPHRKETLEGIYDLVLETVLSQKETIWISKNSYPVEMVRERFLKLDSSHVEYVIECMSSNTTKIRNIKQYLLTALFNAPSTISAYYQAQVNHDMPQFAKAR